MGHLRFSRCCRSRRAAGKEYTAGGPSADCAYASQPHLQSHIFEEVVNSLTGGGQHAELGE